MNAREYLQKQNKLQSVTFVIAHAVKDAATPFYHYEYKTMPVFTAQEMLQGEWIDKYMVINSDHPPVDITGTWHNWYKSGRLSCAMLTTEDDLRAMYSEKQAADMIAYYNRTVK